MKEIVTFVIYENYKSLDVFQSVYLIVINDGWATDERTPCDEDGFILI